MKNKYERDLVEEISNLIIESIDNFSIAEEMGLEPDDEVISVNSEKNIDDLDFYYLTSFNEFELSILKSNGEIWDLDIEKDDTENLGIELKDNIKTKTCSNHCLFCFIDQMPKGMRDSLYIKDDDERLSFLNGNYITLTNLSQKDLERIIKYKIPINVSIHTTDLKLRQKLLGNKKADQILNQLTLLSENNIEMNAQIVLVPDLNDITLDKTINDLIYFFPSLKSVSIVPVGKTKHRDKLFNLRTFTKDEALSIIKLVEKFQKEFLEKFKTPFVYLADEFYLLADSSIPTQEHYGNFEQYENGIGMVRSFQTEFIEALENTTENNDIKKNIISITGKLFAPVLKDLIAEFNKKFPNINVKVVAVENNFFGNEITVTGLLTGEDILKTLKRYSLKDIDFIVIPETVLKKNSKLLLDDISIEDIQNDIKTPVKIVSDNGKSIIDLLVSNNE